MCPQKEASLLATLSPILLLCRTMMVASSYSCGTPIVIHTTTMMLWNASRIPWEMSESPSSTSSADSSPCLITLPLDIYLSVSFVSSTTGGSRSDRATALAIGPQCIRLREVEVVLRKEVKYCLHLPRMSSSFHRSFPSSSLIYCALPTFLPCNLHPLLRCPYQSFMSPALVNSTTLQAHTSRPLYSAACMNSLNFLHAFRNARKEELPAKAPRTTVRAFSFFVQAS